MSDVFVAVLMGSDSDLAVMQHTIDVLKGFDVAVEVRILSAHRVPEDTRNYVLDAERRGCAVFIAAAGLAAHLAGAVAASTCRPVIGVPMAAGSLQGMDALLSTVQMPGGVPVACVAIGKPGAQNAAHLAVQILSLQDADLYQQLQESRRAMSDRVRAKDRQLAQTHTT